MSLRRRPKPLLAASAVAKARSRPTEKSENDSSVDEKVLNDDRLQQGSNCNMLKGVGNQNSNEQESSQSILKDLSSELETKQSALQTKEVSKADDKLSLSHKRFTKVRPMPNLNSKKSKIDKPLITENEKSSSVFEKCSTSTDNVKESAEANNSFTSSANSLSKLTDVKNAATVENSDIKTTMSDSQVRDSSFANQSNLCNKTLTENELEEKPCYSGFIVTNKEISDITDSGTLSGKRAMDCLGKDEIFSTSDIGKPGVQKKDLIGDHSMAVNLSVGYTNSKPDDSSEKSMGVESVASTSVSSIKGRFKKSKFLPNLGRQKGKTESNSGGSEEIIPHVVDAEIIPNVVDADQPRDKNIEVKGELERNTESKPEIKQRKFRRTSIRPNIAKIKQGNEVEYKNDEKNLKELDESKDRNKPSTDQILDRNRTSTEDNMLQRSRDLSTLKSNAVDEKQTLEKSNELVSNTSPGEVEQSGKCSQIFLANFEVDAKSNNESNVDKKLTDPGRKPRRARFKPNLKTKEKSEKIDDGSNTLGEKTKASQLGMSVGKVTDGKSEIRDDKSVNDNKDKDGNNKNSFKKHVRFTPNIEQKRSKKVDPFSGTEGSQTESADKSDQSLSKECGKNNEKSPSSMSHSDAEDGSQSESEGLHHHGKRKFAPCLGPRVRQRRRLSSMTLSEDESGPLDGKVTNTVDNGTKNIAAAANTLTDTNTVKATAAVEDDTTGKKKAKKRTRIVMKEPKEKMTMFDFIYYNPQSKETDKNGNEEGSTNKKQRQDQTNILPESETILETIGPGKPEREPTIGEADDNMNEDDNQIVAPQIRIGEDGNVIIDEDSLVLKTTRSKMSLEESQIVYDDGDSFNPYRRRKDSTNKKRWPVQETLKFYRVLSRVGTDFSLMTQFFPDCTRRNLKQKFKTEEKFNGDLVDRALKHMLPMDEALFEELEQNKKNGGKKELEEIEAAENQINS